MTTATRTVLLLAASSALVLSAPASAQEDGAAVSIGTYRVLHSQVLGETRRLLVHLPRGYEGSTASYPVVYHTYGNFISQYYADAFATLEQLAGTSRIPQMILVGIDNIDRYRDLRPLTNDGSPSGADEYLRFLADEVIPFVERNYRTSPYRVLVGPQAGAVFGLYALMEDPGVFDAFILNNPLTSPPNTELLLTRARVFFEYPPPLARFVHITFGSAEESPGEMADVYRLAQLASSARHAGLELHLNSVAGNDDFIPPLDLRAALRTLFRRYGTALDRDFGDLSDIRRFYADLSTHYGFDIPVAEFAMMRTADALLQRGGTDEAVTILEYATRLYPNSVDAWWRLAGIAAERGEIDRAIELYEKCQEIDPSVANFVRRQIERLTVSGLGAPG